MTKTINEILYLENQKTDPQLIHFFRELFNTVLQAPIPKNRSTTEEVICPIPGIVNISITNDNYYAKSNRNPVIARPHTISIKIEVNFCGICSEDTYNQKVLSIAKEIDNYLLPSPATGMKHKMYLNIYDIENDMSIWYFGHFTLCNVEEMGDKKIITLYFYSGSNERYYDITSQQL